MKTVASGLIEFFFCLDPKDYPVGTLCTYQCFGSGSGSGRIRIIWPDPDPDPDPYQETLINANNKLKITTKKHRYEF